MYTKSFLILSGLLLFSGCKEQIEQVKTKIEEIKPEAEEVQAEAIVYPEDDAKAHLAINLPSNLTIEDSQVLFTEKKSTEGKISYSVDFESTAIYNEDLYAVDKNLSFFSVLRNRGWEDELYQGSKAAPYTFLKKIALAGDPVTLSGSFKWNQENIEESFGKIKISSNSSAKGKVITSYSDKYLLPDSDKSEEVIEQWLADQQVAKTHRTNVLNAVTPGKRYTGTMKLKTGEVQNITLTITKQHLALKQTNARINFEHDDKISIELQGMYITDIRPAGKSHINYNKVLKVNVYGSPKDPFFIAVRTYMAKEYIPFIIEDNKLKCDTLSGLFTFDLTALQ